MCSTLKAGDESVGDFFSKHINKFVKKQENKTHPHQDYKTHAMDNFLSWKVMMKPSSQHQQQIWQFYLISIRLVILYLF